MDKVYIIHAIFDRGNVIRTNWYWKFFGMYTNRELAEKVSKKWSDFYNDRKHIFNRPKDWVPSKSDEEYLERIRSNGGDDWKYSEEYTKIADIYNDILYFKEIKIEEYYLNREKVFDLDPFCFGFDGHNIPKLNISDDLRSLMIGFMRDNNLNNLLNG